MSDETRLQQLEREVTFLRSVILRIVEITNAVDDEPVRGLSEPAASVEIGRCQLADEINAIISQSRPPAELEREEWSAVE